MKIPGRVRDVQLVKRVDASISPDSFLSLHHLTIVNTYNDDTKSQQYLYDAVLRKNLDAVVVLLTGEVDGIDSILLRLCIRPPLLLRREIKLPTSDEQEYHQLWELPAGLLEQEDFGLDGIKRRASLETLEETGYWIESHDFTILPGAPFGMAGAMPERFHFVRATVPDVTDRNELGGNGDGSPVEEGAALWWVPVAKALDMCDQGEILDMKTELGIRRLLS